MKRKKQIKLPKESNTTRRTSRLLKLIKIKEIEEHSQDKEYILNHIANATYLLEYIDTTLLEDKNFITKIIKLNGLALKYACEELKKDKEIVIIAIQNSAGFALKYASKELQADRDVVLEAIKKWKGPLQYASEELQEEFYKKINDYYEKHKI